MINWPIEGNDFYVNLIEMTDRERKDALEYAKHYTMCFLYFIQHELGYNTLGLADDEYTTEDKLPLIPYYRESRRIHGKVRFTLNHIVNPYHQPQKLYRTCIAVGDYPVDHHHTRYHGYEELPNLYFYPVPSFGLPLGTLIPQDVENLIVAEKSISVSNIANGTTRLQPVVLQIGQAAGALAALAVSQEKPVAEVGVRDVQNAILSAKGYLLPYLDVPVSDARFQSYQRIGSTGILKGVGRNVEWSNQTWLRADTLLLASELEGLKEIYSGFDSKLEPYTMTVKQAVRLIEEIAEKEHMSLQGEKQVEDIWKNFSLGKLDWNKKILRGEMAVLLDQLLDPFNRKPVDLTGEFKK